MLATVSSLSDSQDAPWPGRSGNNQAPSPASSCAGNNGRVPGACKTRCSGPSPARSHTAMPPAAVAMMRRCQCLSCVSVNGVATKAGSAASVCASHASILVCIAAMPSGSSITCTCAGTSRKRGMCASSGSPWRNTSQDGICSSLTQ
ncbi:hypothetical protein D3C81_1339910 [compost metagenome]